MIPEEIADVDRFGASLLIRQIPVIRKDLLNENIALVSGEPTIKAIATTSFWG
jgi:hypothetical protein